MRPRDQRGQIGGIEAVVFGMLILVVGTLVVANAWAVVDAKLAAGAAAREAARAYVKTPPGSDAMGQAIEAGQNTLLALGRHSGNQRVEPVGPISLTRCATATFRAVVGVPLLSLPWLGHFGTGFRVTATHREIVDPYRNGLTGTGPQGSALCD